MSAGIPTELAPLLESSAVAVFSTIGPQGEPQTTPIWFVWKDGALHFSLVDGRQKLRNLQRDPRASVVIVDPAEPTNRRARSGSPRRSPSTGSRAKPATDHRPTGCFDIHRTVLRK